MKKILLITSLLLLVGLVVYVYQAVSTPESAVVSVPAQPEIVAGVEKSRETQLTDYRQLPSSEAILTPVITDLDAPWAFTWLPNGDVLITERFGSLRLWQNNTNKLTSVTGVPAVYSGGQGGLLDVTVHPEFVENGYVYLSYAHGTEEGNKLRVARAELIDSVLENVEVVFETAQTKSGGQHFGSRFAWLPDGTLVFSVGDGGNPPLEYAGSLIREQAQNLSAHFGKIIRINDDGTVPEDNPFVTRPDALPEIYSYGHRNVQGITYDQKLGRLVASEHGSKGGDELNLPVAGGNFGWPLATYATEYAPPGTPISPDQSLSGMIDPLITWTPTIAPSSITDYTGSRYGETTSQYFLAAMVLRESDSILSYVGNPPGAIMRIAIDETGVVTEQQRIMVGDVRVRSLGQGPDGYLYVLTDQTGRINSPGSAGGALWRVESL